MTLGWAKGLRRGMIVALVAGVVLALTGAFNTGLAPLPLRLGYWLVIMAVGGLWGHLCGLAIERRVDPDERPWLTVASLTALISGPLSVVVWALTGLILNGRMMPLSHLPFMLFAVALVTAVVSVINVFLAKAQPVQTHAAAPGAAPATPRFLERLPPRLRGASLHAVEAEDHYLRLHTDRGSDLILLRLTDALSELEGLEGAQTHRSWWVAKAAVVDVERGDGRATLTLAGGARAPVSRRYARALRETGWY